MGGERVGFLLPRAPCSIVSVEEGETPWRRQRSLLLPLQWARFSSSARRLFKVPPSLGDGEAAQPIRGKGFPKQPITAQVGVEAGPEKLWAGKARGSSWADVPRPPR